MTLPVQLFPLSFALELQRREEGEGGINRGVILNLLSNSHFPVRFKIGKLSILIVINAYFNVMFVKCAQNTEPIVNRLC